MSKPTPGPWHVAEEMDDDGYVLYSIETDGLPVADIYRKVEHEANARLIAAAPEMLEALRRIEALYCNLRYGGPAPEDLQSLSDALEEACNTASNAIGLATRGRSHD